MAKLDLESNNQERDNTSEEILWRSEDVTFCSSCPSSAIFNMPHPGGDLAQEVAEDKTNHDSISLVPSGHHRAPIKRRKADKARRKDMEGGNDNSSDIIGELLFDSWLCSFCRRAS